MKKDVIFDGPMQEQMRPAYCEFLSFTNGFFMNPLLCLGNFLLNLLEGKFKDDFLDGKELEITTYLLDLPFYIHYSPQKLMKKIL